MGKGKKDKKQGSDKAPKSVAGVKIPKPLRKAGKEALKLAKEPVVSEIVAAALLSAAAALRGDKAAGKAVVKAAASGGGQAEKAGKQASKIGDSLRDLAIDLARRTLDNWERPAAKAEDRGGGGGGGGGRRSGKASDAA